MLASVVGPKVAATDLKSPLDKKPIDKDFKGNGSEPSFGKALDDKMSTKQQQPKEVKEKPEPEVVRAETKPTKKTTGRQQAIQDFMDSFESEFEIPPTRLVEAMAQLKDSQLKMAPEDTAEAVISQLDLPAEDAEKAQAMYASLLAQLNQMPQAPKEPSMMVGAGLTNQGMQERIASAQGRQDMLMKSVDQLNSKFWANPKVAPADPSMTPGLQNLTDTAMQTGMENLEVDESSFAKNAMAPQDLPQVPQDSLLDKLPPHLRGQMKEAMSPALLAALAAKHAETAQAQNGEATQGEEPVLIDEFQQAAQAPKAEAPVMGASVVATQAKNQAGAEQFNSSGQDSSFMQQNPQSKVAQKAVSAASEAAGEVLKKADFKQSLSGLEGVHGAPIKGETLKADMGMPMAAPVAPGQTPTPAENEAAVKQVMNQAQYLIKQGGGEMKVQMTPEGMGTIHLKVMLQDGKVNMQMSADTQEAKKTIESSLAELKTSLAAHKLSMENVKVDVVNSASTDTATQNQTNMNGQNRDQARQFWNQFNENFGNSGRRESWSDVSGLRGYGKKQRDPLQPIETASRPANREVEGKGSGLNLVA
ncbi:flagellar hook-length control protein [Bdellovibrio bacteriovorus]|uniref:Flagellar hook-length control protein n=1 Tax=Bdellovibrio bacteriovorus TaxID=959 RepID=A0A150WPH2_BDEBC|nr:flagellar hook-length control protein FliK [Bdellovibrio bacteriovorus]KYG66199.1 flagellar hook-length control protein [Bdellovibrio bacteriovorus]